MSQTFNLVTYIFIFFSQLDSFFHNFNFIVYFVLNYFNYRIYQVSSKEKRNILFKKITNYKFICNKYDENNEPIGIVIHNKIIPHFFILNKIYHQDYITLICRKSFYNELNEEIKTKEQIDLDDDYIPYKKSSSTKISYITKRGEYGYFEYGTRIVNLENTTIHKTLSFYDTQKELFRDIMNFYKTNHFCKVFLSGKPGVEKRFLLI
jgi:hypothetical protein